MSDPQRVGEALMAWIENAVVEGRLAPGAVTRQHVMQLAHSADQLSEDDIGTIAPDLAGSSGEVLQVIRGAGAASTAPEQGDPHPQGAPATVTSPQPRQQTQVGSPWGDQSQRGGAQAVHEQPDHPPAAADLGGLNYAPYQGGILGAATQRVRAELIEGQLTYSWPRWPGGEPTVVYRVITHDITRPQSPEEGRAVGASHDPWAADPHPMRGASRTVQVWVHAGADLPSTTQAEPQFWAETTVVSPVTSGQVQWDHGAMIASWSSAPGIDKVRVYRLPAEEKDLIPPHELDNYLVRPQDRNLYGVTDPEVVRGTTYVYRVVASARGESGPPVDLVAEVPYEATAIEDLTAEIISQPDSHRAGVVALQWTQAPEAQIAIYRSERMPQAGLVGRVISLDALHESGLSDRVPNYPEPVDRNTRRMSQVQWPGGWTNAYFVPVTLTGREGLPGRPVRVTGVPAPGRPDLGLRGDLQVISFDWPEAAGSVRVHTAPRGADPAEVVRANPTMEVNRETYIKHGGIRLDLPSREARDVILTAWVSGQSSSVPVVVTVPSRMEVRYSLTPQRRMGIGSIRFGRLTLWNEQGIRQSPGFVVVHNEKRLPLHAEDGQHLELVPDDTPDATPQRSITPPSLTGGPQGAAYRALAPKPAHGYVRVFVSPSVDAAVRRRILVLDPPISDLIWKSR